MSSSVARFNKEDESAAAPTPESALEASAEPTLAEEEVKADHSPIDPLHEEAVPEEVVHEEAAPAEYEPVADPVAASRTAEDEGRSVFVGGLSWNLDNDWLKEEVEKALEITEGVVSVRIARDHMGRSKGYVHCPSQNYFLSSPLALLAEFRLSLLGPLWHCRRAGRGTACEHDSY